MSAPTLAALYDFETQIETAVAGVLTAGGVTVGGTARGADVLNSPCVEVVCNLNGPWPGGNSTRLFSVGGDYRPDQFSASLLVTVLTDRKRNASSHGAFRGNVRALLYQFVSKFTGSNLPYLVIMDCTETGSSQSQDESRCLDITVLSWDVRFAILPTAWPT